MSLFKLALRNIFRTGMISSLAIFGMALAIACAGIVLRLNILAEQRFSRMTRLGDIIIGPKASPIELMLQVFNGEGEPKGLIPENLFRTVKAGMEVKFEDGAKVKAGTQNVAGWLELSQNEKFRIVGVENLFEEKRTGLVIDKGEAPAKEFEMVAGASAAASLNLDLGKQFDFEGTHFKISGTLAPTGHSADDILFIRLIDAQGLYAKTHVIIGPWGPHVLHAMIAQVGDARKKELRELINFRTVAEFVDVGATLGELDRLTLSGRSIASLVAGIITILGGLLVTVLLATRFESQAAQVALLRVMGFRRERLLKLLILEAFILCGLGVLFGAFFELALFPLFKSSVAGLFPAGVSDVTLGSSWPVWGLSFLAVFISLVGPFLRMLKTDVHLQLQRLS